MTLRADLAVLLPERMKQLPVVRGFPVPWFVAKVNGEYDFRIVDPRKFVRALRERRCWVCGEHLGAYLAFVIGPMCAVNRVTSEPPCHRECAIFSATACPFLTRPHMDRRTAGLPDVKLDQPAGIGLERNPGVALVWITKRHKLRRVQSDQGVQAGYLIDLGPPQSVLWYCQGRPATREEVMSSIESGVPQLRGMAVEDGVDALEEFDRRHAEALTLVPG